jgi:tetratricopeptide (TPR) repeat protein
LGLLSPQGKNPRKGSPKKKKDKKFYLILAVLALLVFVVLSSNNEKKENPLENINNEEAINQESEKNKQLLESYRKQAKKSGKNTLSYEQAQASYLIGFRDFEHGLYNRAIDAFQACLSIQPQHILCNRYIQLSQTKFDELIQYKMIIGRQYKEQNQFQACKKAFENIMFMVKDRSNKVYSEAKENYDYCSTMIKGQF